MGDLVGIPVIPGLSPFTHVGRVTFGPMGGECADLEVVWGHHYLSA